jgi:hypothetical protein
MFFQLHKTRGNAVLPVSSTFHFAKATCRLAAFIIVLSVAMAYCEPKLLICIPGKQNTQRLQSGFDALLGSEKAVVLGRIKDLEALLPTNPDAAIISNSMFFNYLPGYTTTLVGTKKKQTKEKFFIVSASKEISKENIADKKIGIIDFLIKDQLVRFVRDQFTIPTMFLKRVNKEDDLLTMLGMEAVDAIVVSASQYEDILSNTKMPLMIISTSNNTIGFVVCAAKDGNKDAGLFHALLKTPGPILKELGIDAWEKP